MRKNSLRPLPRLKKEAEKWFHKYIVKRDNFICYTCNRAGNQAGHYWHGKLDFDERNLHCQCPACNKWKHGNLAEYGNRLLKEFGQEWVDKLYSDAHQTSNKFSRDDLEQIIEKYKNKVTEIKGLHNAL